MKFRNILAYAFLAMLAGIFSGCGEDDNVPVVKNELNDLQLAIEPLDISKTTFEFDIKASDDKTPYVCLYVPRSIIDRVPKYDLPSFLMDDLRKEAEEEGRRFEDYLKDISHLGDFSGKLDNLAAGTLYEIVAFAANGDKLSDHASFLYFQTLKITPVDCSFEVVADAKPNVFTITPSVQNVKYYLSMIDKDNYEKNVASGWDDTSLLYSFLNEELQEGLSKAASDGSITDAERQAVIDGLLFTGTQRLTANFAPGVEYRWLIMPFEQFEWELLPVDDISAGWILPNPEPSATTSNSAIGSRNVVKDGSNLSLAYVIR